MEILISLSTTESPMIAGILKVVLYKFGVRLNYVFIESSIKSKEKLD